MKQQLSTEVQVLVEENNIARTPNDIDVKIIGNLIPTKTVCSVKLAEIKENAFIGILI